MRPSLRTAGLNLCIGFFYCLACVLIPWIAIFVGNWKNFLLIVSFPHLLVLTFYFLIPESAQWLISKGRIDNAIECFQKIAKINGKFLENWQIDGLKSFSAAYILPQSAANLFDLFKTPKLRRKTLILIFKSYVFKFICFLQKNLQKFT